MLPRQILVLLKAAALCLYSALPSAIITNLSSYVTAPPEQHCDIRYNKVQGGPVSEVKADVTVTSTSRKKAARTGLWQ